jgi:hypothetical protein
VETNRRPRYVGFIPARFLPRSMTPVNAVEAAFECGGEGAFLSECGRYEVASGELEIRPTKRSTSRKRDSEIKNQKAGEAGEQGKVIAGEGMEGRVVGWSWRA